jgi:hypothetical protein
MLQNIFNPYFLAVNVLRVLVTVQRFNGVNVSINDSHLYAAVAFT